MRSGFVRMVLALGLGTSLPLVAIPASAGKALEASWSDGIRMSAADGSVKLKIGGRIMNDWVFQKADSDLKASGIALDDGTEFRRARFYFSGTVGKVTEFKSQIDFSGGDVDIKDLYMGVNKIPGIGTIRVGHQYEPMGLNETTSSKYITFIERATPMAFVASRKTGILATNQAGSMMWSGMMWRESDSVGMDEGDGEYNFTGRLTVVPVNENDGRNLVHLGVAASRRNPAAGAVRYSARPENHMAPRFVDTGSLGDVDAVNVIGAEAAAVFGPLSLQGEFLTSMLEREGAPDPSFSGFYAFASYFLTGEYRPYKASSGTFSRVKPHASFDGEGGRGAWEVAARVSRIDLEDGAITGGELTDFTAGVNWYLNPNFRWMLNYVRADLKDTGVSNALVTRFQTDF